MHLCAAELLGGRDPSEISRHGVHGLANQRKAWRLIAVAEIRYPGYRTYETARVDANNSMIALLAGAHLSSHSLQLMEGSTAYLAQIFPGVPHLHRFNLTVDRARPILQNAEDHLGAVSVPYALAVHEDFVTTTIDWIDHLGLRDDPQPNMTVRPWNMHEIVFHSASQTAPSPILQHFHLLREMRNCQIHAGGLADARLHSAIRALVSVGSTDWIRLTGRPPEDVIVGGRVRFVTGDIIVAFATSKWLARDVNGLLANLVPRAEWAGVAARDFAQAPAGQKRPRNSDQWMRSLFGYARNFYAPLGLGKDELAEAAVASGLWTRQLQSLPEGIRP